MIEFLCVLGLIVYAFVAGYTCPLGRERKRSSKTTTVTEFKVPHGKIGLLNDGSMYDRRVVTEVVDD